MNAIETGRDFIDRFRFGPDRVPPLGTTIEDEIWRQLIVAEHSQHALSINRWVTPGLEDLLSETLLRLKVPRTAVTAYVFASPEVQAQSITLDGGSCLIRISSALVNLLEGAELQFVLAHEVGHFLCRHSGFNHVASSASMADFHRSRNQEISADRAGFLGANNLDACIRALIKTVSGLRGSHLRFDVPAFLSQIAHIATVEPGQDDSFRTHPSLIVRSRALLFFSLDCADLCNADKESSKAAIQERLDRRVVADLTRFTEPGRAAAIAKTARLLEFWHYAEHVFQQRKFTKVAQTFITERFGEYYCDKLKALLQSSTPEELTKSIPHFIQRTTEQMKTICPDGWEEYVTAAKLLIADRRS